MCKYIELKLKKGGGHSYKSTDGELEIHLVITINGMSIFPDLLWGVCEMRLCASLWSTSALEEAPEGWVTGSSWQTGKEERTIRRDWTPGSVKTFKPHRREEERETERSEGQTRRSVQNEAVIFIPTRTARLPSFF